MTPLKDTTENAGVSQILQQETPHQVDSLLDLYSEDDRLRTFDSWPVSCVNKKDLAAAGFYYTGVRDIVKCPYCKLELGHWTSNDNPEAEHRRCSNSSKCLYLLWKRSLLPIQDTKDNTDEGRGYDTCGPQGLAGVKLSILMYDRIEREALLKESYHNSTYVSVHEAYLSYNDRLKTFTDWPATTRVSIEELSDAGFFYSQTGDGVTCFHCGGCLREWKENDDPWIEHAGRFPDCKFVLVRKGQKFIDAARTKVQPSPSKIEESKGEDAP